ncbi:Hypothetical protein MCYN_0447 [Mycoplasmopsis cynos C142]|uniref:Uncharacterized protein n=1 Tax=Mycoplasmopsis cynos (strain C142) TaxID=1246955 RepID=L0RUQ1_MYCC1|nr:Hypothetical protein MCYN_0447 [Mycoplasmopsis cynos C142]
MIKKYYRYCPYASFIFQLFYSFLINVPLFSKGVLSISKIL